MIGMYDEPVAVPIVDLLDSNMMLMYVNSAKSEYERAYKEQKEFAKEFGDLYSPSTSLNQAYYDQTRGRVLKAMDYLYLNGIDPIRSLEGRAYILKVIRETPYQQLANWKSDAENMKLYNKAKAALMAEGKYDKDYDDYMLEQQGLSSLEKFDPYSDLRWTAISPAEYKPLDTLTKPYSDQIKPTLLSKDDVTGLGQEYDPNNDYLGISYNQINAAADKATDAIATTPQGQFEIQRIKSQMQAQGLNPSDADAQKAFASKIAASFSPKAGIQTMDANKFKYAKYLSDLADALDAKKSARDLANQIILLKKQHEYSGSSGTKAGGSITPTIFDVADAHPTVSAGLDAQSSLKKNNVALDKNVTVTEYPLSGEKEGYTSVLFNTQDVTPIILKRGTNTPLYWKAGKKDEIQGKVLGNLTKFVNGKYYVKVKLTKINGLKMTPDKNKVNEIWLEAKETVNIN